MEKGKVIVGMSGGVDSSVAALRLKQQGWQVEGLFMKNWEEDDDATTCSAAEDLADARAVAELLQIPLHTVNFSSEYWDRVFAHFLNEYRAGRTPNPDVLCNREIKFKAFLDHALSLGAKTIATGHYAAIEHTSTESRLSLARDRDKDQTYFLYMVSQQALRHTVLPLSDLSKTEVRSLATEAGFPNHRKKDSTGICFIGERRFKEFLGRFLPAQPGEIRSLAGDCLGEHQGLIFYTIGQRHGLGIGGQADADETPWFVVAKDMDNNVLTVAQGHDHPLLLRDSLTAGQLHWIAGIAPPSPLRCHARLRHRQPLQPCTAHIDGDCMRLEFDAPQRAVTPGQSAVLYHGQRCLGGGIID